MKKRPNFYKSSILLIITLLAGCAEKSETVGQMRVGDGNKTVVSSNQSNNLSTEEFTRLQARAANIKIIRDDYGVPHIYGKTDADTVFGLLFACWNDIATTVASQRASLISAYNIVMTVVSHLIFQLSRSISINPMAGAGSLSQSRT